MNDEQLQPLLDRWYRQRETPRPMVQTGVASVMARVPQTRQRGRCWPFPFFDRRSRTPTATDSVVYAPDPVSAPNGQFPTVTGRTQAMISPSKAFIVGALVLSIGGVMLIAQPFGHQGGTGATTAPTDHATPLADLLYGAEGVIGETTFASAAWTAVDAEGDRPEVGSEGWMAVANSTADELGAFLLTVRPQACYRDIYLDVWSVYGAFKLVGAGAKSGDQLIQFALNELFKDMATYPPECGPGWSPDGPA